MLAVVRALLWLAIAALPSALAASAPEDFSALAPRSDGSLVTVLEGQIGVYQPDDGGFMAIAPVENASAITLSPNGRWAAWTTENRTAIPWTRHLVTLEVETWKLRTEPLPARAAVMAASPEHLAILSSERAAIELRAWPGEIVDRSLEDDGGVFDVANATRAAFSPDGTRLVVAIRPHHFVVFDVESGELVTPRRQPLWDFEADGAPEALAISPDNGLLLAVDNHGPGYFSRLALWNLSARAISPTDVALQVEQVRSVAWTSDALLVAGTLREDPHSITGFLRRYSVEEAAFGEPESTVANHTSYSTLAATHTGDVYAAIHGGWMEIRDARTLEVRAKSFPGMAPILPTPAEDAPSTPAATGAQTVPTTAVTLVAAAAMAASLARRKR